MSSIIRFKCDACGKTAKGVSPSHLYVYDDPPEGWTWAYGSGIEGPHGCSAACWDSIETKHKAETGKLYLPRTHADIREANARAEVTVPFVPPAPEPPKQRPPQRVYFIQRGDDGPIKIGVSRNVASRLSGLQVSTPEPLKILATADGGRDEEQTMHLLFKKDRLSGEWFRPSARLMSFVAAVAKRGTLFDEEQG